MRARLVSVLAGAAMLSACGLVPSGDSDASRGGEKAQASSLTQMFTLTPTEGGLRVLGHGLSFVVPKGWTEYAPEQVASGSSTSDWAVQAAEPKDPFVPYVDVSAAVRAGNRQDVAQAVSLFKGVQTLDKDFVILDEGKVSVAGAKAAYAVHFTSERDVVLPGDAERTHLLVETRSIFLNLPGGEVAVVRFTAPQGHFADGHFPDIEASLRVAVS